MSKGHAAAGAMMVWVACAIVWDHGDVQIQVAATKAAAKDYVWVLSQSESVLKSVARIATEGHVDAQGQVSYLRLIPSSSFSGPLHTSYIQIYMQAKHSHTHKKIK